MAAPIEMLFIRLTHVGPSYRVLDWVQDSPQKGAIFGDVRPTVKLQVGDAAFCQNSLTSCYYHDDYYYCY